MSNDIFSILGMLFIVVIVLLAAYFCTRYLAKHTPGAFQKKGRTKKIILLDQLTVGNNQRILLVQVGSRYILLGTGASGLSLLLELTDEEIELWKSEDTSGTSGFSNAIMSAIQEKKK